MKRRAVIFLLSMVLAGSAAAAGASQHFSEALVHSVQAAGHSVAAGVKVAFAVVAVPLLIGGEIGNVSGQVGEELWDEANRPIGAPLAITGDVVTAGPPPGEVVRDGGNP
jgi:hypothetical protein